MSEIPRVATQGGEYSYHAMAAKEIFGESVDIEACTDFAELIEASRAGDPGGVGVIAVKSAFGTIDRAVEQLVQTGPAALPVITARVDIPVSLVLAAANELELDDLDTHEQVIVHAQKEAWEQCEPRLQQLIKRPTHRLSVESTRALRDIIRIGQPDQVAIGPAHAVEPLGAYQIGNEQLNPAGSLTRFYALQRDPRLQLFHPDPEKTTERTVVNLAHPESPGEMDKVLELFRDMQLVPADFINFAIGDKTRHRSDQRRAGGIFEIEVDRYGAQLLEFCARVEGLRSNDRVRGQFSAHPLGAFDWYPEVPMDLNAFSVRYDSYPV